MKLHTLLPGVAAACLLAACATSSPGGPPQIAAAPLTRMMAEADIAAKAGQYDKALLLLKDAGSAYPAEKAPWLQMAQMKFDRTNYGDAISNALEALRRDPGDKVGNSIVAVSGLRLSTRALADLTWQNNVNGSLRTEAQDMEKLLHTSLGEDVLVPQTAGARRATPRKQLQAQRAPAPAGKPKSTVQSSDPFGGLK